MAMLSCIVPFAIRLLTEERGKSGRLSGSLYGLSTLGSLLGVFLPVLVLIPTIGVRRSLLFFGVCVFLAFGDNRFPGFSRYTIRAAQSNPQHTL